MKRNSLLTAALVMFLLGLLMLNKAFAANQVAPSNSSESKNISGNPIHP